MKQAVILAAGEGNRLRPFTANKPKAMIYIAGKPIIEYVINAVAGNGIREIVLVVGYKREQIFDYLGDGKNFGVNIKYITQNTQLGTAHALLQARKAVAEEFLVLPGDKLISQDTLSSMVTCPPYCMLIKKMENPARYGTVEVTDGQITDILNPLPESKSSLINTGIYVFNREIFNYIDSNFDMPDVIRILLKNRVGVLAVETDRSWLDVIYPWDILGLNSSVLQTVSPGNGGVIEANVTLKGNVYVGKNTIIRANSYVAGPVVIGDNCEIGPNVCILPATSIGNSVAISPFTEIRNSIISDGVRIGSGCDIQDTIIDKDCVIGGHFNTISEVAEMRVEWQIHLAKIGTMIGEGCQINNGVIALPGTIIGNYCQVKSLKTIMGQLADKSLIV